MNKQTDASLRNFRSRYDPKHVLHPLLAQPKNSGQNNRQRTHNQVLSIDVNAVIRQNFSHIIVTFINRVHRVILRTVCYTPLSACAYMPYVQIKYAMAYLQIRGPPQRLQNMVITPPPPPGDQTS